MIVENTYCKTAIQSISLWQEYRQHASQKYTCKLQKTHSYIFYRYWNLWDQLVNDHSSFCVSFHWPYFVIDHILSNVKNKCRITGHTTYLAPISSKIIQIDSLFFRKDVQYNFPITSQIDSEQRCHKGHKRSQMTYCNIYFFQEICNVRRKM